MGGDELGLLLGAQAREYRADVALLGVDLGVTFTLRARSVRWMVA